MRELARDREPEPGPATVARPERPEDPFQLLVVDSRSGVRHDDRHRAVRGRERELDAAAFRRPAERVREQVRDDLEHAVAVRDDHRLRADVGAVVDRATPGDVSERRERALAQLLHVDLFLQHREPVRVELRKIEHVADEPLEPHRLLPDHAERRLLHRSVVDHALAQCGYVAADRRERRSKLVRHRHEEVPRELLRLGQLRRHVAEARREMRDLVAAARRRHLDVVVAAGDLVRGRGEREQRLRDPPRKVQPEESRDDHAAAERDRQLLDQRDPAAPKLRHGLRDDHRTEELLREIERFRDGEVVIRPVMRLDVQVDCRHPAVLQLGDVDRLLGQGRERLEQPSAGERRDEEDLVAADRALEARPVHGGGPGLARVQLHDSDRLSPQLVDRMRSGIALEEPDRDQRRDEPGEDDAEQEQRR